MTTACTCPCGRCTGQVAGGHAECPYNCGRSTAWLGQTETDRLELGDLSAYLRQRGPVGGVSVAAAAAPPIDLYRWPGFTVRRVVAEAGDEPGTLAPSKPLLVPELLRPTRRAGDVPTTAASAGAVPAGGRADRDPGRAVLGVAPFAIADGDGSLPDPESRPGSGELAIPTAGEPRPVPLFSLRRIRWWRT